MNDDLWSDNTCPGCGLNLPFWRVYPYHLPNGVRLLHGETSPPWPYLDVPEIDGFNVACEWDRRALMRRFERRHGVAP